MVKVVLEQGTPSQAIVKAANAIDVVKDRNGRQIGVKKLTVLSRMRLFELVGSDLVKNEFYFGFASLAFMVTSLDDDAVSPPTTKLQLEGLVQRLDDDGLDAVAKWAQQEISAGGRTEDEVKAAIKNG